MSNETQTRADLQQFVEQTAQLLEDRHCTDIVVLDVRKLSQVCDYVVIGTGTSDRQMKSVAGEVEDLGKSLGHGAFRSNRDTGVTWIVIDFVDVVVHLFEPNQRDYYDLEALWSDAPRVDVALRGASDKAD